mgnify:FL=1|tara:strand:+ start:564 stop:1058 length:495 start_codon:yes stop_codon:yes gene_type:complete
MSYSTAPKVRRDGVIKLRDGTTPTPVSLTVDYEEGNFSFEQTKSDRTIIRDRGTIKSVRRGDDQPITGSFTIFMRQFTSSSAGSVLDFINKTGSYSSNISSSSAVSTDEYAINIVFEVDGDAVGDSDGDTLATFDTCICTASFAEGDPNTITISFECFNGVIYS